MSEETRVPPRDDGDLWHGDLNEVLHALAGKEPCETACTHYVDDLIGTWTLLGLANVATRSVQRVPNWSDQ